MKTVKTLSIFAALLCSISIIAQTDRSVLTAESLRHGGAVELDKLEWLYQTDDDLSWARRDYDDAARQRATGTNVNPFPPPNGDRNGRAWFRLHLKIGDDAANRQLALAAIQRGASEIYIDGVKLIAFGEIENFARPNRDLAVQLAQVETLSAQKIEQEKHAAEPRAF